MACLEVGRGAVQREVARELRVQPPHLPEQHAVLALEALLEWRVRATSATCACIVSVLLAARVVGQQCRLLRGRRRRAREVHRAAGRPCTRENEQSALRCVACIAGGLVECSNSVVRTRKSRVWTVGTGQSGLGLGRVSVAYRPVAVRESRTLATRHPFALQVGERERVLKKN